MSKVNEAITGLMITFVCLGFLIMALSVPMILRRIKPNPWYGFRTPKTMANERIWYEANAYSGRLLLALGAIWLVSAVALRYVPGIGTDLTTYCTVCIVLLMVGLSIGVALSFWRLRSL